MKQLKFYTFLIPFILLIVSCGSYQTKNNTTIKEQPVVIANEALQYEIIIIDPGFTTFLNTQARSKEYYSESYLKNKNRLYVNVWNNRVRYPQRFNSNIYENAIDYQANIDYGLDVNYKLYWYFKFAEQKYKMKLSY
ncbi:hypothetical protein KCTC32516_01277 [Polaribacter huanghezhanensis]|uniref:DUF6146 family protein n=1 Tax=Polaribacter huanghezhanensis TaxID=1354726 RepID=UPI0026491D32|nr:DUF6146 family protein [Polaribacter huanghezhanensis]WKD85928.1 hypothetical protein KCTC32516_01277 [Polaribacter huanghezhanensis]